MSVLFPGYYVQSNGRRRFSALCVNESDRESTRSDRFEHFRGVGVSFPGRWFPVVFSFQIRRNQERTGKMRTDPQKQGGGQGLGLVLYSSGVGAFAECHKVETFEGRCPRLFLIGASTNVARPRCMVRGQVEKERPREV